MGLVKPCLLSLSLSPLPHPLPLSLLSKSRSSFLPRAQPRWRGGPAPESAGVRPHARGVGSASPSVASVPVPPVSPRQLLDPLPATRAAGKSGSACCRCGDPGHFIDRCPVMEVGTLVRVPDAPQAAPDQAGMYHIPVCIKGGTYWALVDSGCKQTSIHQSLIQPEALDKKLHGSGEVCTQGRGELMSSNTLSYPISGGKSIMCRWPLTHTSSIR